MKKIIDSKKIRIALFSLIAIFMGSVGSKTLALYVSPTEKLENQFEIGSVTTKIEEDFEPTEEATVFKKTPIVTNIGGNDCYVRARVTVSPEGQLDITGWNTENWIYNKDDGFYYYQKVLKAGEDKKAPQADAIGESTTPLFTKVSVKDEYVDTIEGFEVTVYQEAVQATMNAQDETATKDMMTIWKAYEANKIPASFQKQN